MIPASSTRPDVRSPLGVVLLAHTAFNSPFVVGSHHLLKVLQATPEVSVLGIEPFAGWRKPADPGRDRAILTPRLWVPLRARQPVWREQILNLNARLFRLALAPRLKQFPADRCVILDNPYAVGIGTWLQARGFRLVLRLTDWMPGQIPSPDRETNFRMLRQALRQCDAAIATSAPIARLIKLLSGRTATVVTNGVDATFLTQPIAPAGLDPHRVIYYGALDDRIDFAALTAAAGELPDTVFDVYTPSRGGLPEAGLPANLRLHGSIAYAELPRVLSGYAFAVLPFTNSPSNHGRFPMKLLEMLGSGVQVVAPPLQSLAGCQGWPGLHLSQDFSRAALGCGLRRAQDTWLASTPGQRTDLLTAMRALARQHTWDNKVQEILTVCRSRD